MSLLAYSLRRAVGGLLVLLVVTWLTWFGVAHFTPSVRHPTERTASAIQAFHQHQPALANEWNTAALEVGLGLLVLVILAAGWRVRKRRTA